MDANAELHEGLAIGTTSAAVLGSVLRWLAGMGLLVIPDVEPIVAAGPVMAVLKGMGGMAVGGLTGALIALGISSYEAASYEGRLKEGCILLSVHADDSAWAAKARKILETKGGADIAISNEMKADRAYSGRIQTSPKIG